ncbi:uncharacterized protein LOC128867802 isoform X1 [Anastrepha ludens]|uniref:uncharacterized protein LOC128867802 isoform X1 n=2 Tax=Anastrepha ludens TaxID=28586 RepID=UPI0023AE9531|nr:uncharacterized protein LOC128867802 isoform X1 [Anastrepha ludens]
MDFLKCNYDKHERVWSAAKRQLVYDFNCSMGKILYSTLKNYPTKICQVFDVDGREVTNSEMLTWSVRLAQHFKKMGLNHNDVVGIVAKNSTYLISIPFGCLMNCTPFHAVSPALDTDTIQYLFETTAPKIIFCDGEFYEKVNSATHLLKPLICTLTNHIDGVAMIEDFLLPTPTERFYQPEPLVLGGEQTAAIICSSGTTGSPKCVCISNYTLQLDNIYQVTCDSVSFTNSSLDWYTGVIFIVITTTCSSKRVITNRPYTPEYMVELVKKYKINCVAVAPRHAASLVTCSTATIQSMSSIHTFLIGGGSVSLPTLQCLQSILKNCIIIFGYGLTETSSISMNFGAQYATSVGKLIPGLKARIVDEQGMNLPPNKVGEIHVKTGHAWNGYYGNPIESQRFQDSLGWFHTGDLGYFDDKDLLYIVDRKKDVVKYQGMQYWPGEIEQVINELPEVEDVCVVSIYDERNGDAAGAVVVRRNGAQLTEQQIKEQVRKRLPVAYKQLHAGVVFVDQLPEDSNGKTSRRKAKALFKSK